MIFRKNAGFAKCITPAVIMKIAKRYFEIVLIEFMPVLCHFSGGTINTQGSDFRKGLVSRTMVTRLWKSPKMVRFCFQDSESRMNIIGRYRGGQETSRWKNLR